MPLPPPYALGLPEQYTDWRVNQSDAVLAGSQCNRRVHMAVAPPGTGKSLVVMTIAALTTGRTCVLTATKALEDQYATDFREMICVVKGKQAHPCRLVHGETDCSLGMCNFGVRCNFKDAGCGYYDQLRRARAARVVVTNYHFWCANNLLPNSEAQDKLGKFDLLVCDEAHNAPAITGEQFTVEFSNNRWVDNDLLEYYPWDGRVEEAQRWMESCQMEAARRIEGLKGGISAGGSGGRLRQLARWQDAAKRLAEARMLLYADKSGKGKALVIDEKAAGRVRVAPLWPYVRGGELLMMDVPKIIMTSATVRPMTARLLGIQAEDCELVEYPHTFPVANRKLVWLPTVRMNKATTPMELRLWQMRIDQILRTRMDRNGVIHSVSYGRAKDILAKSQYADSGYLLGHAAGEVERVVEIFKMGLSPRGLVSPSVGTGFNFPDDECRFQIITKLPWPDTSDPLTAARCDEDENLAPYQTMTELVQAAGRANRSAEDWSENYIIDDNVNWFVKRNKDMAPKWFVKAFGVLRRDYVPEGRGL